MKDYSERVEFSLSKAKAQSGVEQAEVFLGANHLLTIRAAVGKILESKVIQDAGLAIRVLTKENGIGFSSTCDLSDKSIESIIDEAVAISRHRKIDPEYSFASPQQTPRKSTFYDKKLVESIYSYDEVNEQVNQMLLETLENPKIKEAAGPTHLVEYSKHIMNSNGIDVAESGTYWNMELLAVAESTSDRREGSNSSAGWKISEIDTQSLKDHAVDMAVRSLEGKKIEPGQYEIILSAGSVSTFLGWLTLLMYPQNQERNMPLLRDKIGEEITSPLITTGHDPLKVASPVSGAYDDEGVPTRNNVLIDNGVYKERPLDTYYATQFQTNSNGTAYRRVPGSGMTYYPGQLYQNEPVPRLPSVYMEGGQSSIDEMISDTKKGIYLDYLHYAYVTNGGTGDYTGILRQGTFLINNGEINHAIQKCRLIDNIIEMAKNVEMIGPSRMAGHWGDMMEVPPAKISQVNLTPY
ncbi:MAG: TldD/PmbA family protein [Candidatus Hodarchaeales archaeon]|jgi:PmbA protein